eukprot:m.351445 g.351445  ORF g.351445 m.351445 type:complete len:494 (+) comp20701_c0_seq1:302-1783(+)
MDSSGNPIVTAAPPPVIGARSTPDDVIAWMATLEGGKDALREYFKSVREMYIDGSRLLKSNPIDTCEALRIQPQHVKQFCEDISKLQLQYIAYSIDKDLGYHNVKEDRSRTRSKVWTMGFRKTLSKEEVASGSPSPKTKRSGTNRMAPSPDVPAKSQFFGGQPTSGPKETRGWLTLKEGYLYKAKKSKKSFNTLTSTKLRYFVLKQEPMSRRAHLEYYEGLILKGALPLRDAEIRLERPGRFVIICQDREVHLRTEETQVSEGMAWVLALQKASFGANGVAGCRRSVVQLPGWSAKRAKPDKFREKKQSIDFFTANMMPETSGSRARGGTDHHDSEIDGTAIDNARWAALRKGWARANGVELDDDDAGPKEIDSEDEDVKMMREMEEEEERRQEEERQAFLLERAKKQKEQRQKNTADAIAAAAASDADVSENGAGNTGGDDQGTGSVEPKKDGEDGFSEDEEDWFAQMQKEEAEEERKQELERQEWLAQQKK